MALVSNGRGLSLKDENKECESIQNIGQEKCNIFAKSAEILGDSSLTSLHSHFVEGGTKLQGYYQIIARFLMSNTWHEFCFPTIELNYVWFQIYMQFAALRLLVHRECFAVKRCLVSNW